MTQYFCHKCNKVRLESSDFYMLYNKRCKYCSKLLKPIKPDFLKRLEKTETKEKIKALGRVLFIHKYDKDNQQGSRHAEDYDNKQKINLDNGFIIDMVTKNIVGKLKEKDLDIIKSNSKILSKEKTI